MLKFPLRDLQTNILLIETAPKILILGMILSLNKNANVSRLLASSLCSSLIICSKLTIETLERGMKYVQWRRLVSLLLTLNIFHTLFKHTWSKQMLAGYWLFSICLFKSYWCHVYMTLHHIYIACSSQFHSHVLLSRITNSSKK